LRAVLRAGRARWPWAVRGTGTVHVHITDRVWGRADGAYNRSLPRLVRMCGAGACVEGVFDPLADDVVLAVDAVQVDLVKDAGAVPGSRGDLGGLAGGIQPQ